MKGKPAPYLNHACSLESKVSVQHVRHYKWQNYFTKNQDSRRSRRATLDRPTHDAHAEFSASK